MLDVSAVPLVSERPISTKERARSYSQKWSHSVSAKALPAVPEGSLKRLKVHLDGLEERLREPRVGDIMDASKATSGRLYELRDQLECEQSSSQYPHTFSRS